MGEITRLSKLTIQEPANISEVNEARDRVIENANSNMQLAGDNVDNIFFIANRPYRVANIRVVQATVGTDAGAQGLQVQKLTGTQGVGSGVNLLSATYNMKTAVANTVTAPALTATAADLEVAVGDRLAVDRIEAPTTGLTNTVVTVGLIPV